MELYYFDLGTSVVIDEEASGESHGSTGSSSAHKWAALYKLAVEDL
jgi:hypothetical protein